MPKTIWLQDEVYLALDVERLKGETFSQVVARLVRVVGHLREAMDTPGQKQYLHDLARHSIKAGGEGP